MNAYAPSSDAAMSLEAATMAVRPMDAMALSMGPMTMGPLPMSLRSTAAMDRQPPAAGPTAMDRGQDKLPWSGELWHRIDRAVHAESMRTMPASAFLPRVGPMPGALTVDSDQTLVDTRELAIDEAATFPLVEVWAEFALTPQQVAREAEIMTACTLAKRATNVLAQATDLLVFQGDAAVAGDPLFTGRRVRTRSGPAGTGLLNAIPQDAAAQRIEVGAVSAGESRFGERTYEAVTEGCARLESKGHYGPYALILHTVPYADTFAPLAVTLETPASLLEPMLGAGFYETGSLPPSTGLLVSVGGNSMDLVVGRDATATFLQQDFEGKYVFRVYKRFALRVKDDSAIIRLDFES